MATPARLAGVGVFVLGGLVLFAERRHDVEAVDLRHHQVEHDQLRQLPPRDVDRLAATVGAQHGTGQADHADRDELHRRGIVIDDEDRELFAL